MAYKYRNARSNHSYDSYNVAVADIHGHTKYEKDIIVRHILECKHTPGCAIPKKNLLAELKAAGVNSQHIRNIAVESNYFDETYDRNLMLEKVNARIGRY